MLRRCVSCGARGGMRRFENETFAITYGGMTVEAKGLSGLRCDACGEVEFDDESARRYASASDDLVLRARERQKGSAASAGNLG